VAANTLAPGTSSGSSDPSLAELRASVSAAETRIAEQRESAFEEEARRRGRDRSQIVRIIVFLFAGAVVLVLIALPVLAIFVKDVEYWNKIVERLVTFVASVSLPVVTLVIGFYFGTEQSRQRDSGP